MIEKAALFAVGALVMAFLYRGANSNSAADVGLPGNDSFYHVKMAEMLPEVGVPRVFPWLRFSYFTPHGDDFVSHHYGFHLLLAPFVLVAKTWTGDPMAGGRWAMCAFAGLNLALFHALLSATCVRFRWLFVALWLVLPDQFFVRHGYVRAIGPSLVFVQLLLIALLRHRPGWTALVAGLYVQLYLGAVLYVPLIVALYALAHLADPACDRRQSCRVVLAAFAGWLIGTLAHPYSGAVFDFLKLQVFGTGLDPDIEVGSEWRPYQDVWWFATELAGKLLLIWFGALALRLRCGPRLAAREWTVWLLAVALLALTLKARRFIEYWPPICLLSAASLLAPVIGDLGRRSRKTYAAARLPVVRVGTPIAAALILAAGAVLWAGLVPVQRMHLPLLAAATLFSVLPVARALVGASASWPARASRAFFSGVGAVVGLAFLGIGQLVSAQSSLRCQYDLPAIRAALDFVRQRSAPGDLILTDDWDIFPVFFCLNAHNHYAVGLDPKFTHERRPDLWERYVHITRGTVPADARLARHNGRGATVYEPIHVELTDIRDHFGARFVITDRDHRRLAARLRRAPEFAQQIYPHGRGTTHTSAAYVVFEILPARDG